jgi:hypothetical protein
MLVRVSFWSALLLIAAFSFVWDLPSGYAMSENVENQYLSTLTGGSLAAKIMVAKRITQSQVINDKIFIELEKQILEGYNSGSGSKHIDQMAWFCKALASSGNVKYLKSLQQVAKDAEDPKLQHYARQSVDSFSFHKKRNQTLSRSAEYTSQGFTADSAQLAVMLKSDEFVMKRDAAKKIVRGASVDPRLFDIVEQELLQGLSEKPGNYSVYVDTMAWMCKALAVSGNTNYAKVLRRVIDESSSPKLQRYAEQSYNTCSH